MNKGGRRWDMLAYGDPVADIVLRVAQIPALGEKVLGRMLGTWAGGTTANAACALAAIGLRSAVFGRVGTDANGELLRASFREFGVDQDFLQSDPGTHSATALSMIGPSGERGIVYMPATPVTCRLSSLAAALSQSRIVYAMPYDGGEFDTLSMLARRCGTLVAIDLEAAVAPDRQSMLERIKGADIVFFNESGFRAGTGRPPGLAAMRELLPFGPACIVVTLGAGGALAVAAGEDAEHPAFAATVVDATGAGDTFNAAFLAARLEGAGLRQALRFACAAASSTVAALGARGGLPSRAKVDAIVASHSTE